MSIALARTAPFRRLQSRIGSATYRLNTILVGLERVAVGDGDSGAVGVGWKKPLSQHAREVADQARTFACAGALVLATDVFDSFLRDLAHESWLRFREETREILTKAKTRTKQEGGDYSIAERAEAACTDLGLEVTAIRFAALDLLSKWRNMVVHSAGGSQRFDAKRKNALLAADEYMSERYSHLDIRLALRNFEARKVPLPKEVTTLIAIAVTLSREIDEAVIIRSAGTPQAMSHSTRQMLIEYFATSDVRRVKPWAELADAWQGDTMRRKASLLKILQTIGITECKRPVSAPLPESFIEEIILLSKEELAARLTIQRS